LRKVIRTYFILLLLLLVILSILSFPKKKQQSFELLSRIPAELIISCQEAEKTTQVKWELLCSYYFLMLEGKKQSNLPVTSVIEAQAKYLQHKSLKQAYNLLKANQANFISYNTFKKTYQEITKRKTFYTLAYRFPLSKDPYEYKDTWLASRDGGKRQHYGTDIFAKENTPIYSVSSGKIVRLGEIPLGGKRIGIRGVDGIYYYYAHLADYNPRLTLGDTVETQDLIGYVGHTGNAINTPDHLHFAMCLGTDNWFNPYQLLRYWEIRDSDR
jgi:murein DD-endopeptidase MepM/ murein hydrolase activator NlpD